MLYQTKDYACQIKIELERIGSKVENGFVVSDQLKNYFLFENSCT